MAKMSDDSSKRSTGSRIAFLAAVAVLSLPILYALSTGPVAWLCQKGYLDRETFDTIYAPIRYLAGRFPAFSTVAEAYVRLWMR
jgi:hypothetical protein